MDLLGRLLQPLIDAVKKALGPFGKLWDFVTHFWTTITEAITEAKALGGLIYDEVQEWKRFKEAIPFRTGVVSIPGAIKNTQALIDQIVAAWRAVVDLANNVRETLNESTASEDPAAEAREALDEIEHSNFSGLLTKFPKLAKGAEKVLGWLAAVLGVAEAFVTIVKDLSAIVEATKEIREEVETGSTVFLSQKNPRRRVHTTEGESLNLRVGNLHS